MPEKLKLGERQRKHLRGLGHSLEPVARLGSSGVTEQFLAELERILAHHELVKLKISAADRKVRDTMLATVLERSGALLLTRIGNVALLYRPNPDAPKIQFPD